MLKIAYHVGVLSALKESGLTKEAFIGALAKGGAEWLSKLPPHIQQMLMGAGIGGAAGGVSGVGVMPGMALGAGGGLMRHGVRGMKSLAGKPPSWGPGMG